MSKYTGLRGKRIREPIPFAMRAYIFNRDNFICQYCGDEAIEIDHILPVSAGGGHDRANLVACCRYCNAQLSNKVFDSVLEKQSWLESASERRIKSKRRRLTLCGDCGIVFEQCKDGASRVLCAECYALDEQGVTEVGRVYQARMREFNKSLIVEMVGGKFGTKR